MVNESHILKLTYLLPLIFKAVDMVASRLFTSQVGSKLQPTSVFSSHISVHFLF